MFANILKRMKVVELGDADLRQPISVTDRGELATVGNLIAEKAPPGVRDLFGSTASYVGAHIKPVNKLPPTDLRRVAVEVLERADPTRRVAAIGSGPYSSRQLIREVEEQSAMGTRIVDAIRLNGVFVETAITSGKIRPKDSPYSSLRAPDFDI